MNVMETTKEKVQIIRKRMVFLLLIRSWINKREVVVLILKTMTATEMLQFIDYVEIFFENKKVLDNYYMVYNELGSPRNLLLAMKEQIIIPEVA